MSESTQGVSSSTEAQPALQQPNSASLAKEPLNLKARISSTGNIHHLVGGAGAGAPGTPGARPKQWTLPDLLCSLPTQEVVFPLIWCRLDRPSKQALMAACKATHDLALSNFIRSLAMRLPGQATASFQFSHKICHAAGVLVRRFNGAVQARQQQGGQGGHGQGKDLIQQQQQQQGAPMASGRSTTSRAGSAGGAVSGPPSRAGSTATRHVRRMVVRHNPFTGSTDLTPEPPQSVSLECFINTMRRALPPGSLQQFSVLQLLNAEDAQQLVTGVFALGVAGATASTNPPGPPLPGSGWTASSSSSSAAAGGVGGHGSGVGCCGLLGGGRGGGSDDAAMQQQGYSNYTNPLGAGYQQGTSENGNGQGQGHGPEHYFPLALWLVQLTDLRLEQCAMGDAGAAALGRALPHMRCLTQLHLIDCGLTAAGGAALGRGLASAPLLEGLVLENNASLGNVGLRDLVTAAWGQHLHQHHHNYLGLGKGSKRHSASGTVESNGSSGDGRGPGGGGGRGGDGDYHHGKQATGAGAAVTAVLRALNQLAVRGCGLEGAGSVRPLAGVMHALPSLTSLDLSHNRLMKEGGAEVAEALQAAPQLRSLVLDVTRIGSVAGLVEVWSSMHAAGSPPCLEALSLAECELSCATLEALVVHSGASAHGSNTPPPTPSGAPTTTATALGGAGAAAAAAGNNAETIGLGALTAASASTSGGTAAAGSGQGPLPLLPALTSLNLNRNPHVFVSPRMAVGWGALGRSLRRLLEAYSPRLIRLELDKCEFQAAVLVEGLAAGLCKMSSLSALSLRETHMLAGKQVTDAYAALWQTALPVLLPHLTELSVGQVDASGPALMRTLALTAAAAEQAGKPLPLRRLSMHRMCLQGEQQAGSPSGSMTSGAGAGAGVGGSPLPGGGPTSRPKPLAGRSPLGLVVGSMSHGPGGDNHDGDRVPSASQLTTPPLPPSAAAAVGGAADADAPPATPAPLDSRGGTSPNNIIDNAKPHHDDDDGTTAAAAAAAAPPDTPSDVHRTYDEVATPASTIGPATPATPDAKLLPISPGRVAYLASVESAWRSLATALSHMPNLTALELVSCALNSMHIDTLAKGLAKCRALEELDLSRNSGMGTAGASALAQALPRLSRLRQLSLVDSLMRGPDVRPLVVALVGHPTCGALECVTVGGRQGLASDHSCVSTEDIKELCHLWVTARHLMSASLVFAVPSPTSKLSPAKSTELEKAERMALALAAMAGGGKRKGGGLFGCFGGGGAVDTQKWRDYWSARQAAVHIIAKETRN